MAESKIEWTDYTFNPWIGCSKVSSGCANCYAERDFDTRRGRAKWGPNGTRSKTSEANWQQPVKWNREAGTCPACGAKPPRVQLVHGRCVCTACHIDGVPLRRTRVFCASLADVFEEWQGDIVDHNGEQLFWPHNSYQEPRKYIPESDCGGDEPPVTMDDLRRDLFELIDATPHLDWLLVTKRPENIRRMWPRRNVEDTAAAWGGDGGHNAGLYRPNVWLLTSVEDQVTADARIPELLKCRDLAPVLGLSCEPLLGAVDLGNHLGTWNFSEPIKSAVERNPFLNWVIAGGESGPGARPMHPDWARSLRDQCQAAGVPFFFKQWGEWASVTREIPFRVRVMNDPKWHVWEDDRFEGVVSKKVGKQAAGRLLDGVEHNEYPPPPRG